MKSVKFQCAGSLLSSCYRLPLPNQTNSKDASFCNFPGTRPLLSLPYSLAPLSFSLSPLLHGSPFLALSYGGITQPTPDTIDLDCRVNHKGAALKASVPRDKMGRGEDKKSSWVARGTIRRGERATSRHALLPSFFIAARPSNDLDDLCLSSHCLGLTMALNSLSLCDKDIRVLILDTRSDPKCQCV